MLRFGLALTLAFIGVSGLAETIYYYQPRLSAHITAQVDSRAAPTDATKEIFASQDHITPAYVRSSTCWVRDIDLTCASPWNSDGGVQKGGTLISPRHIIFANHFPIAVSSTIRFVKMDGTVVDRTLTSRLLAYSDVMVGLLDSAVPPGISFAKLLPASVDGMVDTGTPRLYLDAEEKALIDDISVQPTDWAHNQPPGTADEQRFFESLVSGDSGNPDFVIIRGEAVMCGLAATGGGALHKHLAAINAAMTTLGGGYQVTTVDLSEFVGWQ